MTALPLNGDQLFLNRVLHQFSSIVHVDLSHEVAFVRVHGFHAEIEPRRDLFDGKSFSQQFEHFAFAPAEAVVARLWTTGASNVAIDNFLQNSRAQIAFPSLDRLDGVKQL